jgi:hypothetical protein
MIKGKKKLNKEEKRNKKIEEPKNISTFATAINKMLFISVFSG